MNLLKNPSGNTFFISSDILDKPMVLQELGINAFPSGNSDYSFFESHNGYNFIFLAVRSFDNILGKPSFLEIYQTEETLAVLSKDLKILDMINTEAEHLAGDSRTSSMSVTAIFSLLLQHDHIHLEEIEDYIEGMEELVVKEQPKSFIETVIEYRKKLMVLKRHYEAFYDCLDDLLENENGYFDRHSSRILNIYKGKADRLSSTVLSLRDYLTQVRDLYQNQIDINLNLTMQFFTVITTIFLPLTLIVGWFGMNFQMPEYGLKYAYPVVIVVSIVIVLLLIRYFKKKKWF